EPESLVDDLINEVVQTPGGLPLLSFTLSELYLRYIKHVQLQDALSQQRALHAEDYRELGGVVGALTKRADEEYGRLDADQQATLQRVMVRMVTLEGGERTRRRVPLNELAYIDPRENERVGQVIARFRDEARLLVTGSDAEGVEYVEPAHDALIQGWPR